MDKKEERMQQAGFMQLKAWQKGEDLAVAMIRMARSLPRDCQPLPAQIIGVAASTPANIAEGYARASLREYLRHLSIARASHAETQNYIHLVNRLELITEAQHRVLESVSIEAGGLLYGLIRSLAKKLDGDGSRRSYAINDVPDFEYGEDPSSLTLDPAPFTLEE